MSRSADFRAPAFFTAGAVGRPGARVFYVQGGQGRELLTLKAEKAQVAALAEYLATLLDRVARERPGPEGDGPGDLALREPVTPAWVVGSIGVAYEEEPDRIVVLMQEAEPEGEEDAPPRPAPPAPEAEPEGAEAAAAGATARFRLTRAQVRAFVERARALVKAGRPPCRVCGRPVDPDGHICARANGHMRL